MSFSRLRIRPYLSPAGGRRAEALLRSDHLPSRLLKIRNRRSSVHAVGKEISARTTAPETLVIMMILS
jgi:hypothetical protein